MARSAAASSLTTSVVLRKKQQLAPSHLSSHSSALLPAGTTPRPPRRRKQPTAKTPAKTPSARLDDYSSSSSTNDDEYTFASSMGAADARVPKAGGGSSSSALLPAGTTPRPPRRRKQPSAKTPAAAVRLDDYSSSSSTNDDDEYAFASSAPSKGINASGAKSGNGSRGVPKSGKKKGTSSSRAGKNTVEKENAVSVGHDVRERGRPEEGDDDRDRHATSGGGKDGKNKASRKRDLMDDLNESMARANLGDNDGDRVETGPTKATEKAARAKISHEARPFPPRGFGNKNITVSTEKGGKSKYILKNALQTIEQSRENEPVFKLFLPPSMIEAVASASFSLRSAESMALEENSSRLMDAAKRCLKSLSSSSSSKKNESSRPDDAKNDLEMALLRLAIYSLRSVMPTLIENGKSRSNLQVAIKLFYHCVVTAGDACRKKFQSFANASSSASSSRKNDNLNVVEYAMLCLAAYEGLGRCLQTGNASSKGKIPVWDEMLPKPDSESKAPSHRQLAKIPMESSLCASSSFLYLTLASLHLNARDVDEKLVVANEFHFASSVIFEACSGEYSETSTFQKVMSNVARPCVVQSLFMPKEGDNSSGGDDSSFYVDALRHAKKAFRILWDGARCIEDICKVKDAVALRTSCLDLQKEAVLFILRTLREAFKRCPNLPEEMTTSGANEIRALFDRSTSSAMKSAGSFEKSTGIFASQGSKSTSNVKRAALLHFHEIVGDEMDEIATQLYSKSFEEGKLRQPLPASYYEYCVYRSIHQWRLLGSVETNLVPPFHSMDERTKQGSSEAMVALSTFWIVHLVLRAQQGLKCDFLLEISDIDCENAISSFEHVVISNSPPSSQSRSRSMLMMLDLPREASKIMAFVQSNNNTRDGSHSEKGSLVAVLASAMGRCLARLEERSARTAKERSRASGLRLSAAGGRARSAALFDVASEGSASPSASGEPGKRRYAVEANSQLRESFETLTGELGRLDKNGVDRGAPAVAAVEMFAKAASFIGRRRFERKEIWSSIQPQILASEILSRVAIRSADKELFKTYQAPNRFVLLSSALEANGSMAESCAALAMAAWCSIEATASSSSAGSASDKVEGDSISEEILLFPEKEILDARPRDGDAVAASGLSPIINRLTRAYVEYRNPSLVDEYARPTGYRNDSLSEMMKNTLMGKVFQVACSSASGDESSRAADKPAGKNRLSKLLHAAVWNKKRYEEELPTARIAAIVREVLKSTVKVAKSNFANEVSSHVIDELTVFLQAQKNRLGDVVADPDSWRALCTSFHVSFAARLADSRLLYFPRPSSWASSRERSAAVKERDYEMMRCSCDQLRLAEKQFASARGIRDARFFAQWAAVRFHRAILSEHLSLANLTREDAAASRSDNSHYFVTKQFASIRKKYASTLSAGSQAVDQLSETGGEAYPEVVESLLTTMKRLLCWFGCHGDSISATGCFVSLQKAYAFSAAQPQYLVGAVSTFLSVSSKFEDMGTTFVDNATFRDSSDAELYRGSEIISQFYSLVQHVADSVKSNAGKTDDFEKLLSPLVESAEADMEMLSEIPDDEGMIAESFLEIDLMIQKQLVVGTSLLLHAKLCLDAGRPASAVGYLGRCRNECKKCVRSLRLVARHSDHVHFDDIAVQVDDALSMCLERSAVAFRILGLRRKAEDYGLMAVVKQKTLDTDCQSISRIEVRHLIDLTERLEGRERSLRSVRTLMKIKALSTPADKLASQRILAESVVDSYDGNASINDMLCKAKNALAYDDSLHDVPCFREKAHPYLNRVYEDLNRCASKDTDAKIPLTLFARRAGVELKLRIFRHPICPLFGSDLADESTTAMLKEITDANFGSGICNAEAHYKLGLISLRKARNGGQLRTVWKGHAVIRRNEEHSNEDLDDCGPALSEARYYFERALVSAPPASFNLTKNVLRCLALVMGPNEGQPEPGLTTASLIHISLGGSARNIVRDTLDGGKVQDLFNVFDDDALDHDARVESVGRLLKDSADLIPSHWHISSLATCPTGEVLVSSLRVSTDCQGEKVMTISTACIFPTSTSIQDDHSGIGIHADVLIPLDRVIERSQRQLHGMNEEVQNEQYNEEYSRRKWWEQRHSIDEDLQALLKHAETSYFGHDVVQQMMIPDELFNRKSHDLFPDDDNSECSDFGPGNLALRFEAAEHEPHGLTADLPDFDRETERANLTKLTVSVIKSKLATFGATGKDVKRMRKAELIDLLLSEMEKSCNGKMSEEVTSIADEQAHSAAASDHLQEYPPEDPCTILVLDEHLLTFPFESMDMLSSITVTRVPSLPFVLATLLETESLHSTVTPKVDARKVKCILDPESNLSESASTLDPALNTIASNNGCGEWERVTGQMPSYEFVFQALLEENSLYLYCGHGGGEKVFSRPEVEELMSIRDDGIRGCRAAIVLMGCSSGKLQSINTPKENPFGRAYAMHYEPEGIAASYLFAGAPCVVGNLWDVTDRDIDRYCLTLMEDFVQCQADSSLSIAKCVANARKACKLRFIVGSAPVCYGVPVSRTEPCHEEC